MAKAKAKAMGATRAVAKAKAMTATAVKLRVVVAADIAAVRQVAVVRARVAEVAAGLGGGR